MKWDRFFETAAACASVSIYGDMQDAIPIMVTLFAWRRKPVGEYPDPSILISVHTYSSVSSKHEEDQSTLTGYDIYL